MSRTRARIRGSAAALLAAAAAAAAPALGAPCASVSTIEPHLRPAEKKTLEVSSESSLSGSVSFRPGRGEAAVSIRVLDGFAIGGLTHSNGAGRVLCTETLTHRGGEAASYSVGSTYEYSHVQVSSTPGARLELTLYTSGTPTAETPPPRPPAVVSVPLHVYIVDDAPLASEARDHLSAASELWQRAGVLFDVRIRRLRGDVARRLLGANGKLDTTLGCAGRFDEPGFSERTAARELRPEPRQRALFFVATTTQSQAEPEYHQAYVSNDPLGHPRGRTVAHELGHLLLGYGHTGGRQRIGPCDRMAASLTVTPKRDAPWTSGLMRDGARSSALDISAADARLARQTALGLPGSRWWAE